MWLLTSGPMVIVPMIFAEFPSERTAGVFSRNITVTNNSNSLTFSVVNSFQAQKKKKAASLPLTDVWMMPAVSTMNLEEKRVSVSLRYVKCKGNEPCTSYSRTFTIHNYGYGIAYTFTHNNITLELRGVRDEELFHCIQR